MFGWDAIRRNRGDPSERRATKETKNSGAAQHPQLSQNNQIRAKAAAEKCGDTAAKAPPRDTRARHPEGPASGARDALGEHRAGSSLCD